jgi:hypothetical protein
MEYLSTYVDSWERRARKEVKYERRINSFLIGHKPTIKEEKS